MNFFTLELFATLLSWLTTGPKELNSTNYQKCVVYNQTHNVEMRFLKSFYFFQGETFFPLIKESRFFDWTLTTLSLVCEVKLKIYKIAVIFFSSLFFFTKGNDATSKILIDILAERLPRNYSYAGHSALSNLSLRLNKYPLKMKGNPNGKGVNYSKIYVIYF